MKRAYIYTRISTSKQMKSGLGLEAQIKVCREFCARHNLDIVEVFIESQSGKDSDRPVLQMAMERAKKDRQSIILIAKLDRLSRSVADISRWMTEGVPFVVAELGLNVPSFMLHIYASIAQLEREQIGRRTSAALQQAKKRGVKLGTHNPKVMQGRTRAGLETLRRVAPHIQEAQMKSITSTRKIAAYLNGKGVFTAQNKNWSHTAVRNILKKMEG